MATTVSREHAARVLSRHIAFSDAGHAKQIVGHETITAIAAIFAVLPITIAREVVRHNHIRRTKPVGGH